jgi:hypothetical protein
MNNLSSSDWTRPSMLHQSGQDALVCITAGVEIMVGSRRGIRLRLQVGIMTPGINDQIDVPARRAHNLKAHIGHVELLPVASVRVLLLKLLPQYPVLVLTILDQ